jgi:reverse gyrase
MVNNDSQKAQFDICPRCHGEIYGTQIIDGNQFCCSECAKRDKQEEKKVLDELWNCLQSWDEVYAKFGMAQNIYTSARESIMHQIMLVKTNGVRWEDVKE